MAAAPKVLFVLGGPGSGKGTQCAKVIENFPAWARVSAGDCLGAERSDPSSKDGEIINKCINEGNIVPVAITVGLLIKAMDKAAAEGKTCFLIDGYPQNLDNLIGWVENVGDKAVVCGVLFYEATEDELLKRLTGRNEGGDDDQIDVIKKRFRTFMVDTMPIVDRYKAKGQVISIDGMKAIDEVWEVTKKHIQEVEAGRKFTEAGEKRRDPELDGRAVTWSEMVEGLARYNLSAAQLQEHWANLRPATEESSVKRSATEMLGRFATEMFWPFAGKPWR